VGTLETRWGSRVIVTRGRPYDAAELDAVVAVDTAGERVGLLTYRIDEAGLEVVTLDAIRPRIGVGSALLARAVELARDEGAAKLWLITTNDNSSAISFYQRRGLRIVTVHVGAVDLARLIKPSIPHFGDDGVAMHDEVELALEFVAR
jgi:ribosomal protein S18 acetylase RimI-like enzyme